MMHSLRGRVGLVAVTTTAALLAAVSIHATGTTPAFGATPRTVISFTFDDGIANQLTGATLLEKYQSAGTFYVNSATVDLPGFLTRTDLNTMQAKGHEIGGHTVTHQSVIEQTPDEANRQVCLDRNTLLSWGFNATSFAYPYADKDAAAEAVVQHCGYNTARGVGDLWDPVECIDCPGAEPFTPPDAYGTRTGAPIEGTAATLSSLQAAVRRAERTGGWLAFNLHNVCDGCASNAIKPTVLEAFIKWLKARELIQGTYIRPVNQVITGPVRPAVSPTPPRPAGEPGSNLVLEPSVESPGDGTGNPYCYLPTGYGTNTSLFARVADAHTGDWGTRYSVSAITDGDRKLVQRFDLGDCALPATEAHRYNASVWYKSDVEVFITLYKRNSIGQWSYWTQGPRLPASADWSQASFTTMELPAGYTGASFGLTIDTVGAVNTDDYSFVDVTEPLAAASTSSLAGDGPISTAVAQKKASLAKPTKPSANCGTLCKQRQMFNYGMFGPEGD